MPKKLLLLLLILFQTLTFAQKKVLDHDDLALWSTIEDEAIAPNGSYLLYSLEKGEKDQTLKLLGTNGSSVMSHERSKGGQFSQDSKYVAFTVNAWKDSIKDMKRR